MIVFHGSKNIVEHPDINIGNPKNDYGRGFYCTENKEMAKEWGASIDADGYANRYEIDITDLSVLNLNDKRFCILHWLGILLKNRTFTVTSTLAAEARTYIAETFDVNYTDYDIIIGYRADDSYFSFAEDFLSGAISYRQLNNAMRLGKLGQQFVLKSQKAFDEIQFLDCEVAERDEWYAKKIIRDKMARRQYFDVERNGRQRGDMYITQILDEEMKPGDLRLR